MVTVKANGPVIGVADGMGGGIGAQIVAQLRQELSPEIEILALGANAIATQKMMQARASRGASGENAIRVSINEADFILGPIGVVVPNAMMGEITPEIAIAVAGARGRKVFVARRPTTLRTGGHRTADARQADRRCHRPHSAVAN